MSSKEKASLWSPLKRPVTAWARPNRRFANTYFLSKSYALCILTNAGSRYANAFLDASGLRKYFTDFIGYDDNHLTKDKNIILLREKHGFDKVIYVGDTLADQRFAEAVPVPFICHEKGFGQCENPEYVFDDYRNLEPMVRRIFAD